MDITWLGQSCFKIKGKSTTVITDPYPPDIGYSLNKPVAQLVTVSHQHPGHSYIQGVIGEPKVVYRTGEYEIGGVLILALPVFHDAENGARLGRNIIFLMELDGLSVCHLGDLGHTLNANQVEEIGKVDILLAPVGGGNTINAAQAAEIVRSIEPKVVIPMHYKTPAVTRELEPVEQFLKEMGVTQINPQPKLSINVSNLPLTTQVILLSY